LCDKHLVAEYRELPRAFSLIKAAQARGEDCSERFIPRAYTLGSGHVRFFYDKAGYLLARQGEIIQEMIGRGFEPKFLDLSSLAEGIEVQRMRGWHPSGADRYLNRTRISERLAA
jgi:hypothetical protein